jgi:hypothetical protein
VHAVAEPGEFFDLCAVGGGLVRRAHDDGHVVDLAFSPDGARLWSVSGPAKGRVPGGALHAWDVAAEFAPLPALTRPIGGAHPGGASLDISPDGRALVVGTRAGEVWVWALPR